MKGCVAFSSNKASSKSWVSVRVPQRMDLAEVIGECQRCCKEWIWLRSWMSVRDIAQNESDSVATNVQHSASICCARYWLLGSIMVPEAGPGEPTD